MPPHSPAGIPVYLEIGTRRTFASAVDWPGWCHSGRDAATALEALLSYGPRYAHVVETIHPDMELPGSASDFFVTERLTGNSTTDFGAPSVVPTADANGRCREIDPGELDRLAALLGACWQAFDRAVAGAHGQPLRKGPRGGGRDLTGIIQHVADANRAYLARLAWKPSTDLETDPLSQANQMLDENLKAVAAAAAGELPSQGPRGGRLWAPRYFVRRVAWHVLDHAWEIEDRVV